MQNSDTFFTLMQIRHLAPFANLPRLPLLGHLCNNKLIITGTEAIPDDIAMGVDVDSMNMSDHVEFDAPQTSDLAETIAKRMLEGIPLT